MPNFLRVEEWEKSKPEKYMNSNIEKEKTGGVKTSAMPGEIRKKIDKASIAIGKVLGADQVESVMESLTKGFLGGLDDCKPVKTANANYLKNLPDKPCELIGVHTNLKLYGSIKAPDSKKDVAQEESKKAADESAKADDSSKK